MGGGRLRESGIAFFRADHQVIWVRLEEADEVGVIFKGSKRDQGRKSVMLERVAD